MARTGIIYTNSNEDGTIYIGQNRDDGWREELPGDLYPSKWCQVSSVQARSGTYSLRFRWDVGDPLNGNDRRAELKRPSSIQFVKGNTYWLGFSFFMEDNQNNRDYIAGTEYNKSVIQFHHTNLLANDTSQFRTVGGRWLCQFGDLPIRDCGPVELGQWVDWVGHFEVKEFPNGFAKFWRDGVLVYDEVSTTVNVAAIQPDEPAYNPKIGIYHGPFVNPAYNYIEFYLDEYRIGDETSDYDSVFPVETIPSVREGIVYFAGAETGDITIGGALGDDNWRDEGTGSITPEQLAQARTVVSAPAGATARAGSNVMRFYYDSAWGANASNGNYRNEVSIPGSASIGTGIRMAEDDEYWIGWSIFIPDDANHQQMIQTTKINAAVTQFHSNADFDVIAVHAREGEWEFSCPGTSKQLLGAINLGQWTDFVLHWKLKKDNTGIFEFWIDGVKKLNYNSRSTMQSGATDYYMKIGMYRNFIELDDTPPGGIGSYTYVDQYYDEVRFGDATSNYASVFPSDTVVAPPPTEPVEISYVGVGATQSGSLLQTVPMPSGIQEGDLLLMPIECYGLDTPVTPSGWTLVNSTPVVSSASVTSTQLVVYRKTASASESSVVLADFGNHHLVNIHAFRGPDTSDPVDVVRASSSSSLQTSHVLAGPTTTVNGTMVVIINAVGTNSDQPTVVNSSLSGLTDTGARFTTSGTDGGIVLAYGSLASAGAVNNTTVTSTAAAESASIVIALKPILDTGTGDSDPMKNLALMEMLMPWGSFGVN